MELITKIPKEETIKNYALCDLQSQALVVPNTQIIDLLHIRLLDVIKHRLKLQGSITLERQLLVYRTWKKTCNAEALSRCLDNWQVRPEKKIAKLYK